MRYRNAARYAGRMASMAILFMGYFVMNSIYKYTLQLDAEMREWRRCWSRKPNEGYTNS